MSTVIANGPLESLEQWDDFVKSRYNPAKSQEEFRNYRKGANPGVEELYRQNHENQTLDYVLAQKAKYTQLKERRMGVWNAIEFLNSLVDESDPDTDLSQVEHAMQAAEAIRKDGHPRWFILTGFMHDLGKMLCSYGEPQWAVVGDTFPVGCAFSDKIVYPEFFENNPDSKRPEYNTGLGIYSEGCGLSNIHLSWGHDEYLYHVTKNYLPEPALYMIRYHSFYPWHREGAYQQLMDDRDREMIEWVRKFNPYDLYSKGDTRPDAKALAPYYKDLIAEFFPTEINW
jgi:inositol oxygenase